MKSIFLTLLLASACLLSSAQEVIAPAGSFHKQGDKSISWTLGEPVVESFVSTHKILTQGFHQSQITVTKVSPESIPGLSINVFPNPATNFLTIALDGEYQDAELNFYDQAGHLLLKKYLNGARTEVSLESFTSGIYFLKVISENKELKTFKIVKN